ncbi:hypothetical protein IDG98_02555 [Pelagibacterales bacterium SAG-MED17]|nr:hypothetical protein [Pelagibacterales bacterium SAG-MED17]
MRKTVLITTSSVILVILVFISYLSIFGIKTDNFNILINNIVKEYNPRLIIKLDDVFIKLNPSRGSININTKDSILISENNTLKISNIDTNLNIIKFIKKENAIKNIKIETSENSIKDTTSLLNSINYDLSRYLFYSQIKKGAIKFKLDTEFDINNPKIYSYKISGFVKDAKLNLIGKGSLDSINFNFDTKDKLTKISKLNFDYQNLNLLSESIEIKKETLDSYLIKGDIQNNKSLINPNILFKLLKINQDFLSNNDISIQSKNFFSFRLNKLKKLKNFKIDSIINFDEIYFSKKYQNLIFLKEGIINSKYENNQFTADFKSNFDFSKDLKIKNEYRDNILKFSVNSKNNQNIRINGSISNGKTLLDPNVLLKLLDIDSNLISDNNVNIKTDNQFRFEVNNSKIENYLINSTVDLEKLEFNKKIQDIIYLKNIKTKLTFRDKLLKLDLKSNYSFFDKNNSNQSDKNIFNLKLNKINPNISDVEIFLQADNNNINTKEFKKYINIQKGIISDQTINFDSNFLINFSIDEEFNIKKLTLQSDLNLDNLYINHKSNLIKKYLINYDNKLIIKRPNILFEYSNDIINLQLDGKYSFNNNEDNFFIKFKGDKNNFEIYSLLDLDNCVLNLTDIQYYKKNDIPSKLEILISNSKKGLNLESISFRENKNYISIKNLIISDDFKIQSVEEVDVNFINKNKILNNFTISKNSNNYNFTGYQIDGEKLVEKLLKNNKKNKFYKLFDNINTSLILSLNKIYLEKNEYLEEIVGEFKIKNNKLFLANVNGVLKDTKKFLYSYRTTIKNEKITNIFIEEPKPFVNNYKFIKGFEEGELKLNSIKIDNTSRSNLKITNFKVKEVPVLAKILILASLQGIADLLTGEGIRFDEFEMDFKTKNNLTEINELYALGPALSIMIEGYIEKDIITSLRGTLVPATTINKTIAKIPLLGSILVGEKTGEGVFGVSFKIKGPPSNLESTVNPIKTLTPRFITRTLENIKGN